MKVLSILACGLLAITVCFVVYVRFAPSDPARWHVDISSTQAVKPGPCVDQIVTSTGSARAVCLSPTAPMNLLAQLDSVAMATPRTSRLAGDAASGRITWVTRSALWGFPDFTTAQARQTADGTRLDVFARLRFGQSDMGVNAARLRVWLSQL